MKNSGMPAKIIAIIFVLIVCFLSVSNVTLLFETIEKLRIRETRSVEFAENLANSYRNSLVQREDFITLNGAYARITGARVSNGIILMKNGMLTEIQEEADPSYGVRQVAVLYEYLDKKDVPFVYIQSPRKPDLENELLPIGTVNKSNENANKMLELLEKEKVPVLDLRPYLTTDEEMLEKYFYKTDHHWNAEGAFVAFEVITEYVQKLFPEQKIISQATSRNNWELNIKENFFLGSHGRRVGIGFAGIEDLIYLTPKFETELSCVIPAHKISRKGTFEEVALDSKYLNSEPDYYNTNPYTVHTGNDYSHVQFRNEYASSDLRILMIKDSFGLPLEGMLATVFQEVDTLDLRHLKENTALEKINDFNPDIVLMMYNPSFVGRTDVFEFGIDKTAFNY